MLLLAPLVAWPHRSTPILVWDGYYTVMSTNRTCGSGRFRNTTGVRDPTNLIAADGSPVQKTSLTVTSVPIAPCHLCPEGKYKHVSGDEEALCLACPVLTTGPELGYWGKSTENRTSCDCFRVSGGAAFQDLHFNVTSGKCVGIATGQVSDSDPRRTSPVAVLRSSDLRSGLI